MGSYDPGFRSLRTEVRDRSLDVEGSFPAWLEGALLRNGPGRFEAGGDRVEHWFDGLAMLRRFAFADGGVRYSNRFLRTDTYREAESEGRISGQFATGGYLDRLRRLLVGEPTDNANVHVARLGGELVALTETPRMVAFDPASLETRGTVAFDDDVRGQHVTAHYRRDDDRGETWGYCTEYGRRCAYHVYRVPDRRMERDLVASIPVESPAYVHSFALTRDHAVLVEPPFVVEPVSFLLPGGGGFVDHFDWRPGRGTRFLAVERATGEVVVDRRVPAFFLFHHVNAFERDGALVLDLVAYPDADVVSSLALDAAADGDVPPGELRRYRVPLDGGGIEASARYEGLELPTVSPAARNRPYRYAYGQASRREGANGVAKVDVEAGGATEWWADGLYAEEPVFVPRPGGEAPDDGVVLATALDVAAERSMLLALDGETLEERARATLPHALPFGFHGAFFPDL